MKIERMKPFEIEPLGQYKTSKEGIRASGLIIIGYLNNLKELHQNEKD